MKNRNFTSAMLRRMLLCALLCLSVAMSSVLTSCQSDDDKTNDSDTQTPAQTQTQDTEDDHIPVEPEQTLTEEITTEAPTETLAPEELPTDPVEPVEPDPAVTEPAETEPAETEPAETEPAETEPVVTEPDTEEPANPKWYESVGMTDSGRFVSEQSKTLKLLVDWEYVILPEGVARVTVNIGVSHYRISAREKVDMGAVQVDGNATLFTTPAFEQEENTLGYTPFYSAVYTTDRETMELEASWQVLGVYSGQEIDTLTTGGTIVIGEGEMETDAGSLG